MITKEKRYKMKTLKQVKKTLSLISKQSNEFYIESTSNHLKVNISITNDLGKECNFCFITPSTPSDWRGMKNFRAFVRREFRANALNSKLALI